MNAGLSNLATLKSWLLAPTMVTSTDYDAQILAIGKAMAGLLEGYCDRKFARVADDLFECSADRWHVVLPRYPVEVVTKIEQNEPPVATPAVWTEQTDVIEVQALDRGMLYFKAALATYRERVRVTYTGGFWWNQQEADYTPPVAPTEEDPNLSLLPEGATAVPDELQMAWRLQCEHVWSQRDKLGLELAKDPDGEKPSVAAIQLLSIVQMLAQPFVRYSGY